MWIPSVTFSGTEKGPMDVPGTNCGLYSLTGLMLIITFMNTNNAGDPLSETFITMVTAVVFS